MFIGVNDSARCERAMVDRFQSVPRSQGSHHWSAVPSCGSEQDGGRSGQAYGDDLVCMWAGMRHDAFLLVKQGHLPDWHAKVK